MNLAITNDRVRKIFDRIQDLHPILEKSYFKEALDQYMEELEMQVVPETLDADDIVNTYKLIDKDILVEEVVADYEHQVTQTLVKAYSDDDTFQNFLCYAFSMYENKKKLSVLEELCEENRQQFLEAMTNVLDPSVSDILKAVSPETRKTHLQGICDKYGEELKKMLKDSG